MAGFKRVMGKNTTTLSINERFTSLRAPERVLVQTIRANNALAQQMSSKNRRLALQMERRPTVVAALRIKKKSLRQRLGQQPWDAPPPQITIVAAGRPSFRGGRGRARGRGIALVRQSLQRAQSLAPVNYDMFAENSFRSHGAVAAIKFRGGLAARRGRGALRGVRNIATSARGQYQPALRRGLSSTPRRGLPVRGHLRGQARGQAIRRNVLALTGFQGQVRGQLRGRGLRGQTRGQPRGVLRGQLRGQIRGQLRGQRGQIRGQLRGRGQPVVRAATRGQRGILRGRGTRGRGARQPTPQVSKEELDKQLDQYMSSTKSYLDQELDSYMTDV